MAVIDPLRTYPMGLIVQEITHRLTFSIVVGSTAGQTAVSWTEYRLTG
jgi:hypothetical protein